MHAVHQLKVQMRDVGKVVLVIVLVLWFLVTGSVVFIAVVMGAGAGAEDRGLLAVLLVPVLHLGGIVAGAILTFGEGSSRRRALGLASISLLVPLLSLFGAYAIVNV